MRLGGALITKLYTTFRHKVYDFVYLPLKLVLLLSVATTSFERTFSTMNLVKTKSRNKINDIVFWMISLPHLLIDILDEVDENDIIKTFMAIRKCRTKKVVM